MDRGLRLPDQYFERLYADSSDPWHFETSPYERRKREILFASLPRERYSRAFEPGCSIGMVTAELATRCDEVVAMEVVPAVAAQARRRVCDRPNVRVLTNAIPEGWPCGRFDLIVLSEVGYYLTERGLSLVHERAADSLMAGGDLVAVHFTGQTDHPVTGPRVHDLLREWPGFNPIVSHEEPEFSLLIMRR